MRKVIYGLGIVLTACWFAQPVSAQGIDEAETEAVRQAESRARDMWFYDQAAWHGTDAMLADYGVEDLPSLLEKMPDLVGYIATPTDGETVIDLVFVAREGDALKVAARYPMANGELREGRQLFEAGKRPNLTGVALRMFKARDAMMARAIEEKISLCSESTPNTLVLPPDDAGDIEVYMMTSTLDASRYPIGGHYRYEIDKAGNVAGSRSFTKTCIDAVASDGAEMFVVSHLLDPTPTEIHFFASMHLPIALGVLAGDKLYVLSRGKVVEVHVLDDLQNMAPKN